jgi:FAD:protein FMN transferase
MIQTAMRFPFKAMGSFCEIQLAELSHSNAKKIVKQVTDEVARLESKYSRFRSDSLLSEINSSAGNKLGVIIDSETQSLFEHALSCFEQSEGLFDITAGSLSEIWDFKKGLVPTEAQISAARNRVGLLKVRLKGSVLFLPNDMQLDFGGLVKEYAADSAARLARELGAQHGLVNLGGDFSVIGPQPRMKPWPIGIASPHPETDIMATIDLLQGGLASSGDYERFFIHEGKRYSHIINPQTGWPSTGLRAVSVAADLCSIAGSVATIAMLKDEREAKEWLDDSGLACVYMDSAGVINGTGIRAET